MSIDSTSAIQPFRFQGDTLDVVRDGEQLFVSVRQICDALGVDPPRQIAKLKGKPWATVALKAMVGNDGKTREMLMVERRSLPMWLATIEPSRVSAAVREKLAAYQCNCADVLARHFLAPVPVPTVNLAEQLTVALAPFLMAVQSQADRLSALENQVRSSGTMAVERSSALKARVRQCANDLARYGVEKKRAASFRIHKRLKRCVGWYGDHCRLDNMPARHEAEVAREMEVIEHETNGAIAARRQPALIDVSSPPASRVRPVPLTN